MEGRYIGDGVYVSFDGYHIWLTTLREDGMQRIALEPPVLAELEEYVAEVRENARR